MRTYLVLTSLHGGQLGRFSFFVSSSFDLASCRIKPLPSDFVCGARTGGAACKGGILADACMIGANSGVDDAEGCFGRCTVSGTDTQGAADGASLVVIAGEGARACTGVTDRAADAFAIGGTGEAALLGVGVGREPCGSVPCIFTRELEMSGVKERGRAADACAVRPGEPGAGDGAVTEGDGARACMMPFVGDMPKGAAM